MSGYTVGYIVGSLSAESINRRLTKALIQLSPTHLKFVEIPIRDLPLYNRDFDTDYPQAGRALKDAIAAVDAVLFVTPEYNRGIPGCLKNAIDWASRPHGTNSFALKPSAMIGASPGKIGTAVGQQSLRSVLSSCNSPLMEAPEAYIQFRRGLITEVGDVTDVSTEQFLHDFIEAFDVFVTRVLTVLPPERLGATG
jgi:chromate reductase